MQRPRRASRRVWKGSGHVRPAATRRGSSRSLTNANDIQPRPRAAFFLGVPRHPLQLVAATWTQDERRKNCCLGSRQVDSCMQLASWRASGNGGRGKGEQRRPKLASRRIVFRRRGWPFPSKRSETCHDLTWSSRDGRANHRTIGTRLKSDGQRTGHPLLWKGETAVSGRSYVGCPRRRILTRSSVASRACCRPCNRSTA
jgi:hypothetical protein